MELFLRKEKRKEHRQIRRLDSTDIRKHRFFFLHNRKKIKHHYTRAKFRQIIDEYVNFLIEKQKKRNK